MGGPEPVKLDETAPPSRSPSKLGATRDLLLSSVVLAALSGPIVAVYALGAMNLGLMWEEVTAIALLPAPYTVAAIAGPIASIALVMRRLRTRRARWLSHGPWISAALLVAGSLLLLGPVGGFHHVIKFGALGYMIIDCESPPEDWMIPFGRCGIRGSEVLLVVTIAAWLSWLLLLNLIARKSSTRSAGLAAEDDREGEP